MNKGRVLVIDDEPDLTDLLRAVLSDAGYEVITADDGHDGLAKAVTHRPDVVLLDVVMPVMDGWATSDHLLSHDLTCRIPIIFLTARVDPTDQLRGWYKGCFDYITKPFEMDDLLARIESALHPEEAERARAQTRRRQERLPALEQQSNHGTL